jgi:hypothetical protein
MEALNPYIPILSIIGAVVAAFVTVKVAIAELKKDFAHLREKIDLESEHSVKLEQDNTRHMTEVRNDIKSIHKVLTSIQINVAESKGRDEVLSVIKDAIVTVAKQK